MRKNIKIRPKTPSIIGVKLINLTTSKFKYFYSLKDIIVEIIHDKLIFGKSKANKG